MQIFILNVCILLGLLKNHGVMEINHQTMPYHYLMPVIFFMYVIRCKPNISINNVLPPSQMTPITLSSISSKLDEIKEIVNNTFIY